MKCDFCGATEKKYFHDGVCRRCITYKSENEVYYPGQKRNISFEIPFELTIFQKKVVDDLGTSLNCDVYIEAVCGAGKTEMCLPIITAYLNEGKRCAWAIPRREIVIELADRLQEYFPDLEITKVCQGYTNHTQGDLIVCTCHQLYRYRDHFDLLILDEPDAFPYANNEVLKRFMKLSLKENGKIIYLSATKDEFLEEEINKGSVEHLNLPIRPNLKLLPVPIWRLSIFNKLWLAFDLFIHKNKRCLIFVPSKELARKLGKLLFCPYLTSESENKEDILASFRDNDFNFLVCTTVLERGVTFKDVYCFVVCADHPVFSDASLVQIAGRVRRGVHSIEGECYFYSRKKSLNIISCIRNIESNNSIACSVLKV